MEKGKTDALLIYTPQITERVSYIVNTLLGGEIILTESKEQFLAHGSSRINYSTERLGNNECWIIPLGLLQQRGITAQVIDRFEWDGLKVFFGTGGDIPFDIFSASFYLLSRYEEYLPHDLDEYGRYAHLNSVAYQEGFLHQPLVNLWMLCFEKRLRKYFPAFNLPASSFQFIPTYDIDIAYSYRHHSIWKNIGGFYRDLLSGRFAQVIERGNVYSGRKKDPFDTFEWLDELHKAYHLKPIYFFLTIINRGKYDKNLLARSNALQKLYRRVATKYISGLHPSWQSGTDGWLLEKEMQALGNMIHQPVTISRNHYLRFTVPDTYRRLISAGIRDDYSMAYGSINGFRASYALPYQWYDLEKESITGLVIHPFCFMEANSFFHQGYSAEQAGEEIQYYHDTVKKVDGEFITLFHNHFITEQPEWIEWRKMYNAFLEKNFSVK